jgi:hypothetical protein
VNYFGMPLQSKVLAENKSFCFSLASQSLRLELLL